MAQILQSHGPERYQTGILHRLFVGFRPLLVCRLVYIGLQWLTRTPDDTRHSVPNSDLPRIIEVDEHSVRNV